MTDELLIRLDGVAGVISLNRPKAIHALTLGMCQGMMQTLSQWAGDPVVKAVILDHSEGRGFCSGGDINLLRQSVYLILVAMGQMLALVTGGFDLSVGTVMALTSVVAALAGQVNWQAQNCRAGWVRWSSHSL